MAVLHVGPEVLKQVNDFCQRHNIVRKGWVDAIMVLAVSAEVIDPREFPPRKMAGPPPTSKELDKARATIRRMEQQLAEEKRKKQPILAPVTRRRVHELPTDSKPAAIEGPPFWKKKGNGGDAGDDTDAEKRDGIEDR